ncbi:protealysin inhibitor emfourin [Nocardioides sp.]|uniref:protealysin inhibitor emfourin n=1 Tax=Nocardioides sp. TaxID=35761 RepID=UPI003784C834
METGPVETCRFVPPYLLRRIAPQSLVVDQVHRGRRSALLLEGRSVVAPGGPAWRVHTAAHGTDLPGAPARAAGQPPSGDPAVDEAADGITGALALFAEVYGRSSYDGHGAPVTLSVHYGQDYDNAFWNGTQLVFGDGDEKVFGRFTRPVDVLGHELTHAVTEHTAGLRYQDQPGALNESMSDVFASCLKQRLLGQTAEEADWLIGAGLFVPGIRARALRDMAAPGTAYDDPLLGQDPQVGTLADYVETSDDDGGVHINSGIPNRAFQLAAVGIGGTSWDGAGRIWYAALTGGDVGPDTDFAGFAAATVAAAGTHADAVRRAWSAVGVATGRRVAVRRSGGFAGLRTGAELDLDGDDPRAAEAAWLVGRVDLAAVPADDPHPDRYVYDLDLCGARARVPEQHLTPDLARLVELVLGDSP